MSQINFRETVWLKATRLGGVALTVLLAGLVFGLMANYPDRAIILVFEQQGYSSSIADIMPTVLDIATVCLFALLLRSLYNARRKEQSLWSAFKNRPISSLFGIPMVSFSLLSVALYGTFFGTQLYQGQYFSFSWWIGMAAVVFIVFMLVGLGDMGYTLIYGQQSERDLAESI